MTDPLPVPVAPEPAAPTPPTPAAPDVTAAAPTVAPSAAASGPRPRRRRRALAGVALVLACLSILTSTLAVWTHQVALNTDRFTSLVTDVVGDPALIVPVSDRVSSQVVVALDLQTRIADTLPGPSKVLAPAMTQAVQEAIDRRLQVALADPRVQKALLTSVSFTHARIVTLLRGQGDVVSVSDGYVYLDVFPIVGMALTQLQAMGLIPATVTLPDLSSPDAPDVLAGRLQAALGITLPPDFGTIQLMPAARLETAQRFVRIWDLVVVVLLILTACLIALALWLSSSRRRMLLALAIGTVIAFLVARVALNAVRDVLIGGIADQNLAGAARAVADAVFLDLRGLTTVILILTVILAIAAYLGGRPAWLKRPAAAASGAASNVEVPSAPPSLSRDGMAAAAQTHRVRIERVGFAAIAVVLVWIAVGPEIALLGLALVVGWVLIMGVISRGSGGDDATAEPGPDPETASAP